MRSKVQFVVVWILACAVLFSLGSAEEKITIEEMQRNQLNTLYDEGYMTEEVSFEDCIAAIDIPIEEQLKSSALVGTDIYLLSDAGIYSIDAERQLKPLSFSSEVSSEQISALRQIFEFNGELYALLSYISEESPLSSEYVKVIVEGDTIQFGERTALDTSFYQDQQRLTRVGSQLHSYSYGGFLYSMDYPTTLPNGQIPTSFVKFDIQTGKGEEIAILPGNYDMIVCGDTILSLNASIDYLGQIVYMDIFSEEFDEFYSKYGSSTLLIGTSISTGRWDILHFFDGVEAWGNIAGAPAGLVYDEENDDLYFCMKGKLHRMKLGDLDFTTDPIIADTPKNLDEDIYTLYSFVNDEDLRLNLNVLDFSTDTIIADAPGNLLQVAAAVTQSYLLDGHYVSIIPYVGVDFIPLPEA